MQIIVQASNVKHRHRAIEKPVSAASKEAGIIQHQKLLCGLLQRFVEPRAVRRQQFYHRPAALPQAGALVVRKACVFLKACGDQQTGGGS
jgi:hypothetical protein